MVQHTIKTIYPKYYPMEVVDFFCEHHSEDAIEKDIKNGYVSVLKIDGTIVATGCFVDNHITRVYVLPEHQKKGYGTFIMKNIEEQIGEKFDKAYENGIIYRLVTTNLTYQDAELLAKPYYINCDMSKYIAYIIDTLNHDVSISDLLDPYDRIHRLIDKYKTENN